MDFGNPGNEYCNTRHNLGYMVLDKIADKLDIKISKKKMSGLIGETNINGEKILFVKPLTYMNLSGDCVVKVCNFYKIESENVIVVYDDIDIEVGKIRIKPSGSAGTHNGMRDITKKLGTDQFKRVRIGSGKPKDGVDLVEHVLGVFESEEMQLIKKAVETGADAILEIINNGTNSAMNKYN